MIAARAGRQTCIVLLPEKDCCSMERLQQSCSPSGRLVFSGLPPALWSTEFEVTMSSTVKACVAVAALMVLMGVASEAQVSLQPGLYERVMTVDAAGSAGQNKDTICMTPAEAKD